MVEGPDLTRRRPSRRATPSPAGALRAGPRRAERNKRAHLEAISALRPAYWAQAHQAGWSALNQEATVSTLPPKIRRRNSVRAADRRRTRRMTTARE